MNIAQTTFSYNNYNVDNQSVDETTYNNTIAEIKSFGEQEPTYVSKDEILKQIEQY